MTIAEPFQKLVGFRLKYENPNDKELAETMKLLFKTVSKQCAEKEVKEIETKEKRKQNIYHRLLGGNTE